jgi:hypothetical protein
MKEANNTGLDLLLGIITMLVLIGLVIFIFVIMGDGLSDATAQTITGSVVNESFIFSTNCTEIIPQGSLSNVVIRDNLSNIIDPSQYTVIDNCVVPISTLNIYESYFDTNILNGDTLSSYNASYQSFTVGATGLNETFIVRQIVIPVTGPNLNNTIYAYIYNATNTTDCLFNEQVAYGDSGNILIPSGGYNALYLNITLSQTGTLYKGQTYCLLIDTSTPDITTWATDRAGTYAGGVTHARDYSVPYGMWCGGTDCGGSPLSNLFGIYGDVSLAGQIGYIDADYSYRDLGLTGQILDDTTGSIATTVNWFPLFIIVGIMIVLFIIVFMIFKALMSGGVSTA